MRPCPRPPKPVTPAPKKPQHCPLDHLVIDPREFDEVCDTFGIDDEQAAIERRLAGQRR